MLENLSGQGKTHTSSVWSVVHMKVKEKKKQWISLTLAIYRPGNKLSPEPGYAGNLILDFQTLELWENKFLLSTPSGLQCFLNGIMN